MTITQSGMICDVCGHYILLEKYHAFSANITPAELHCHEECKALVEAAQSGGGWEDLPDGPLKYAYMMRAENEKSRKDQQ